MSDKKRILIVEDEPALAKLTSFRLKSAGYEVIIAVDGRQGLKMAGKERPDLIVLDLELPVMDGYEVCRRLKDNESLKDIPVVILTASVDRITEKAEQIGADDYLTKPYEPQDLLLKIKKFLE